VRSRSVVPAFQVKIAYLTPYRHSRRYFHQIVVADDKQAALVETRDLLSKRSPSARIVHEVASLRPDSQDAEAAIKAGWSLRDGWWSRPIRAGDDLAAIATHGYASSRRINVRTTAGCVAIDRIADVSTPS